MSIQPTCDPRLHLIVGDITQQAFEAVVNAANSSLLGGGGVDGAIHRHGGEAITAACREIWRSRYPDGLPTGEAVMTVAGNLPARYVIHTVGPVYGRHGGQEGELLAACYHNALALARAAALRSVAFPLISTGVYGYPIGEAAPVVWRELLAALADDHFEALALVFFRDGQLREFVAALR